ncbi:MAG: redox-sensing transcriptional repressor Rex [Eubacteriales bacterium]
MLQSVSIQTLQRLPDYLNCLKSLLQRNIETVSAKIVAESLGLGEIQVRKDLASVSSGGKPKVGYVTRDLVRDLETYLGYHDSHDAVLVGAGKLGKALLSYEGFREYGLNIVAAFDTKGSESDDDMQVKILPVETLSDLCRRLKIRIGIITVPAVHAQEVCDILVQSGVLAIWNFAPTHLHVPGNILVRNENMAASLAILSRHLSRKLLEDQ